jgi:ABC-type sugar transport system ATPase subunit
VSETDGRALGIEIRGLVKRYGDTIALDGLDIDAEAGRILGIAGPNGAGKSTMIKVLAAEVRGDEGHIRINGETWSPSLADRRVAVVHQEPQLFPNLTVAENVLVGRERSRWLRPSLDDRERELMRDRAILDVADEELGLQPLAIQQRTEIARALAQDTRVVLFDEPNSALTEEESDDLFRRMHELADAGRTVILVSHRLSELAEHSDRVAVILDGRRATVLEGESLTADAIARTLVAGVGAAREHATSARTEHAGAPALRLQGVGERSGAVRGVVLTVPEGTIVALAGVEGSGARELVRAIAGFERTSGTGVVVDGERTLALQDATAFVSADRAASLFGNLTVGENVVSRLDTEITGGIGMLRFGRMETLGRELRDRFHIKTASLETPIRSLSGGNQQKVAIAAAVVCAPRVLVLEEPTRGVDIGSKGEIYDILRGYASEGHAVVLYCTEMLEVFEVAASLYVVSDGAMSEPLDVSGFTDVESLASAASALERHARRTADAAA